MDKQVDGCVGEIISSAGKLEFVFAGNGVQDENKDKCADDCSPGTTANTKAMHDTK